MLAENVADLPGLAEGQDIIRPLSNPIKPTGACGHPCATGATVCCVDVSVPVHAGHITIMRGNMAPLGSVAKITGKEGLRFEGAAAVYDSEEDMVHALERGEIKKGTKTVVIIRYEGPKGGPGMPEMRMHAMRCDAACNTYRVDG
jgi:dihydroxy-acid dehydratase